MAVTPRLSAAVLATRDVGRGLEVLLVLRSPALRFFGGYWALPGGALDAEDRDAALAGEPTDRELARCGLRELFEETGCLAPGLERQLAEPLRAGLLENDAQAARAFRELLDGAPQALECVHPIGTRTTPAMAPVRFQTRFLQLSLEGAHEPHVIPGELADAAWLRPEEILQEWLRGERLVVPPVLAILTQLRDMELEALLAAGPEVCSLREGDAALAIRSTPGIAQVPLLTPTLPPATTTNCYVVGEAELYVVDPATYEQTERERLFALLDGLVERGARLAGVLVTHHHPDHVGSVAATAERYDLPVYGHPLTLERLPEPVRDGRPLDEGSVLELGLAPDGSPEWKLEAMHTPGHDRGHLVFRESRYGALIAGDLASTVSTILIEPPEGHLSTYLATLERMLQVDFGHLYPAHGPAARDGHGLLQRYLRHRAMRRSSLEKALAELGPGALMSFVPRVYADLEPALHGMAGRSLQAGLEQLQEEGLAQLVDGKWSATD
ncbi:MAG: ribonuclease/clavin/mitogillin [Planctomycetota bacterium]|jgi:ribonuclease/clavin/mitogillin